MSNDGPNFTLSAKSKADINKQKVVINLLEMNLIPCPSSATLNEWDIIVCDGRREHSARIKVRAVTKKANGYYHYHLPLSDKYEILALVYENRIGYHLKEHLPPGATKNPDVYFKRHAIEVSISTWQNANELSRRGRNGE